MGAARWFSGTGMADLIDVRAPNPTTHATGPTRLAPARPPARSSGAGVHGGGVWWTDPTAAVILLALPGLAAAYFSSPATFREIWNTPKAIGPTTAGLMLAGILLFVIGSMVAHIGASPSSGRARWGTLSPGAEHILRRTYPWLVASTVFGYAAWISNGVLRNGLRLADMTSVLTTQDNRDLIVKDKLPTLPGISTLTQVGLAVVVVGVLLDLRRPSLNVRRAYRLVIALAFIRSFFLAERLAVFELLVPLVVLRASATARRRPRRRWLVAAAPLIGAIVLVGAFSASEYSRSWNFFNDRTERSFIEFNSLRLVGYYATSYNNGALLIENSDQSSTYPYDTLAFIWESPIDPGAILPLGTTGAEISDAAEKDKRTVLREFGNPEFNSPGGVATPLVDYGRWGGLIFMLLAGFAVGTIHAAFVAGRLWALLVYPVFFIGVLELPRYLYWTQGRLTPALVVLVGLAVATSRTAARRLAARRGEAAQTDAQLSRA